MVQGFNERIGVRGILTPALRSHLVKEQAAPRPARSSRGEGEEGARGRSPHLRTALLFVRRLLNVIVQ
ncbi:MAG: hypothetical protein JWQ04_677 [Pedosphaera sp.]|nr:hypothetical protein [Pedosphaera sp.]